MSESSIHEHVGRDVPEDRNRDGHEARGFQRYREEKQGHLWRTFRKVGIARQFAFVTDLNRYSQTTTRGHELYGSSRDLINLISSSRNPAFE